METENFFTIYRITNKQASFFQGEFIGRLFFNYLKPIYDNNGGPYKGFSIPKHSIKKY